MTPNEICYEFQQCRDSYTIICQSNQVSRLILFTSFGCMIKLRAASARLSQLTKNQEEFPKSAYFLFVIMTKMFFFCLDKLRLQLQFICHTFTINKFCPSVCVCYYSKQNFHLQHNWNVRLDVYTDSYTSSTIFCKESRFFVSELRSTSKMAETFFKLGSG